MKTTKLLSVAITALVTLASTAWADPHGGGAADILVEAVLVRLLWAVDSVAAVSAVVTLVVPA